MVRFIGYAALAAITFGAWPASAQASTVTDGQVGQLFLAGGQLKMLIERGLRSHPPVRAALERLSAAEGCAAWDAAFTAEVGRADEWTRLMVAAARATVPVGVLAAATQVGITEGDAMLRPYRPEMIRAMADAGANMTLQAGASAVAARIVEAGQTGSAGAGSSPAEIDAMLASSTAFCTRQRSGK